MSEYELECNCNFCHENPDENKSSNIRRTQLLSSEFCDVNKRYEHRVNTSELYRTLNIPERFEHSYVFSGYGSQRKDSHPVYKTSNAEYGWMPPNAHTVPHRYFPRTKQFTELLAKCGMYRNYSLNTCMEKPRL